MVEEGREVEEEQQQEGRDGREGEGMVFWKWEEEVGLACLTTRAKASMRAARWRRPLGCASPSEESSSCRAYRHIWWSWLARAFSPSKVSTGRENSPNSRSARAIPPEGSEEREVRCAASLLAWGSAARWPVDLGYLEGFK